MLRIRFPRGDWVVSGLVVKGPRSRQPPPPLRVPRRATRPVMAHEPPRVAYAGQPLTVSLAVDGRPATIRLHYRNVDQTTAFRTIEGNGTFVISGADISARWIHVITSRCSRPTDRAGSTPTPQLRRRTCRHDGAVTRVTLPSRNLASPDVTRDPVRSGESDWHSNQFRDGSGLLQLFRHQFRLLEGHYWIGITADQQHGCRRAGDVADGRSIAIDPPSDPAQSALRTRLRARARTAPPLDVLQRCGISVLWLARRAGT